MFLKMYQLLQLSRCNRKNCLNPVSYTHLLWHLLSAQSTILWIRFLLVKGSVIWEMQQPMLPTRFLPSALPLHYWSELAVLPVFPSVLDAKSRKLPPKQRDVYKRQHLYNTNIHIITSYKQLIVNNIFHDMSRFLPVSYTHLDVYKRQVFRIYILAHCGYSVESFI